MENKTKIQKSVVVTTVTLVLGLFLVNLFLMKKKIRFDLTRDKRYTLHKVTKHLLQDLDQDLDIRIFMKGNHYPAEFKRFTEEIKTTLEDFRRFSNGRIHYEFVNPLEGIPDSLKAREMDRLAAMGILPYNVKARSDLSEGVSMQLIFPGALLEFKGKKIGINLLEPQPGLDPNQSLDHSVSLLEFNFDRAIERLKKGKAAKVAYLLGNKEPLDPTVFDALNILDKNYDFDTLNLRNIPAISHDIQMILILDPIKPFSRQEKLKIDQYLMNGGKILWAIHPIGANLDSLKRKSSFLAFDRGLDIADMLFNYGARVNPDIIQDLQSFSIPITVGNIGNRPQIEQLPWPYSPLLNPSGKSPVTANLDLILSSFPGSIDTMKNEGIRKTVLLTSSDKSRTLATPLEISVEEMKVQPPLQTFHKGPLPVAVLLEGKFTSAFKDRVSREEKENISGESGKPYLAEGKKTGMIIVSDPNIFKNEVSQKEGPLVMGMDSYTRATFANRDFFENALLYLTDTSHLMQARNKELFLPLLDKTRIKEQKNKWTLLGFLIPILLAGLTGWIFALRRKQQYAS